MPDYIVVLINSVVSFILLFIVAKMLGKKQIAELSFIDYVVGISIGSIVANWATDLDTPFEHYLIALLVYFIFPITITLLGRKTLTLKAFLRGRPIIIIENGKFVYENLKKSKLDVNDILGMCRDKGYFSLSEISYAIFETNGGLSIMPVGKQKPTVVGDFDIPVKKSQLEKYVIIDGKIEGCIPESDDGRALSLFVLFVSPGSAARDSLAGFADGRRSGDPVGAWDLCQLCQR